MRTHPFPFFVIGRTLGNAVFDPTDQWGELARVVTEYFPITAVAEDRGRPVFVVHVPPDGKGRFLALRRRLEPSGLLPMLRRRDGRSVLLLIPRPPQGQWRWPTNVLMFALTLGTTFLAGYLNARPLVADGLLRSAAGGGWAFAVALMLILLTHEMGHKIVSVVRGIDASLPYFIPMLPPVGTMGAVIVTRTPAPNRDALIDLGASGPIAGFVVAVVVVIVGLARSFVLDASAVQGQILVNYPDPLLIKLLTPLLLRPPDDAIILMHPVLYAGWIGLLVTSINLLPAGMLDGGHVVRALFGPRLHWPVSWLAVGAALALRYYLMAILLAGFLVLMRRSHTGPLDDISPPSPSRIVLGLVLVAIFAVSVVPVEITLLTF